MAETPANPFKEGAESSVDAQKAALTQLLADQGAKGAQLIQNRAQDAQALSGMQQQQYGQTGSLYQTFDRDAQQAAANHANEQARTTSANQFYMDQVKAAIPIHQAETDAYYEALRKEYEDRQAERAQAMALARMSASRSSGRSGGGPSLSGGGGASTPLQAASEGTAGAQRDILSAAAAIGFDVNAAKRRWVDLDPSNPFAVQDAKLMRAIQAGINDYIAEDLTWAEVVAQGRALAAELGLDYASNVQPWLAVYSPLWGVQDSEWVIPIAQGPSNTGRSSSPRKATNVSSRASGRSGSSSSTPRGAAVVNARRMFK